MLAAITEITEAITDIATTLPPEDMAENITKGIKLMGLGLGTVFATLVLFYFLICAMVKIFRPDGTHILSGLFGKKTQEKQ